MSVTAKHCSPSRRLARAPARVGQNVSLQSATSRRTFLKRSACLFLVSGMGSSLLSACGGSLDAALPDTPRLASVENFRDVAGTAAGYPTVDGKQMRRGAFYRSNVLTLNAADTATIDRLGIASIYDLRTPGEIAQTADVLPRGATSQSLDVLGTSDFVPPVFETAQAAASFMEAQARSYVTGAAQRTNFGTLLTELATGAGAQLFHSAAGKDRAGWVSALLLSIANVPLDVITRDYLLSNVYMTRSIAAHTQTLQMQDGGAIAAAQAPLLEVQESYLQAGLDQVQKSYGTMVNYLTQGLGVSQSMIDQLRDRLVM